MGKEMRTSGKKGKQLREIMIQTSKIEREREKSKTRKQERTKENKKYKKKENKRGKERERRKKG